MAIAYAEAEAEADPQFMLRNQATPSGFVYHYQTYHNTPETPASTAPLVAASDASGEQKIIVNPYAGAYNPYWYNNGLSGLYSGYNPYAFGRYGGYPYAAGAPYATGSPYAAAPWAGYPYGALGWAGYPQYMAAAPAPAAGPAPSA